MEGETVENPTLTGGATCLSPTETLYFFGGNNMTEWNSLFQHYESPPYVLPHTRAAYSFGIAGQTGPLFSPVYGLSQCIFQTLVLWPFGLQAPELESPFTGTVQDSLRSSTEKRWTVKRIFDPGHRCSPSDTNGPPFVHAALVLLPTQAGASFWPEPLHPVLGDRSLPEPAWGRGSSGVHPQTWRGNISSHVHR